MTLMIGIRYLLWRASRYGLEMRAKKTLIDLIVATQDKANQSANQPTRLTENVLLNYNFSLQQLQKIHAGDFSELQLARTHAADADVPPDNELLVDLKTVKKKTRGITAEEHKELIEKQLRAVHKLKKDFGIDDIRAGAADTLAQGALEKTLEEDGEGLTKVGTIGQVGAFGLSFIFARQHDFCL